MVETPQQAGTTGVTSVPDGNGAETPGKTDTGLGSGREEPPRVGSVPSEDDQGQRGSQSLSLRCEDAVRRCVRPPGGGSPGDLGHSPEHPGGLTSTGRRTDERICRTSEKRTDHTYVFIF